MSKFGAVIVSRMSSSRLPGKACLKIEGKETVTHVIDRIKKCRNLDEIVLATSENSEDDILEDIGIREGISVYRGSLQDVAVRMRDACREFQIDNIVRITADDLVRDDVMIDRGIGLFSKGDADSLVMENMPYGTATEIFRLKALERIIDDAADAANTGFMEYYLQNRKYFNVKTLSSDYHFDKNIRMTLDYREDFVFFERLFKILSEQGIDSLSAILDYIKSDPQLVAINCHKTLDYDASEKDWTLISR